MAEQEIGLVKFLEQRKLWLQNEIRQADIALTALRSELIQPKQNNSLVATTDRMKWAPKIDKLFEDYNGELTLHVIFDKIGKFGTDEAKNKLHRASINACLSRRVQQGKLYRVSLGIYRKKKKDEVPKIDTSS